MVKTRRGAGLLHKMAGLGVYIVREGDTLADVLRVTGASARELAARNARLNLFCLKPGTRLRVPAARAVPACVYRVRRGEDVVFACAQIRQHRAELLKSNAHLRPGEICRGARIALPEE
jgi:hypothetical protein